MLKMKQIYVDANDASNAITAVQAKTLIRQLIAGFTSIGIKKGDNVLIHSFNSIFYPIIVLALIGCGAGVTGTNPGYTVHELTFALKACKAKLLICDPEVLGDVVTTSAKNCNVPMDNIIALDSTPLSSPPQDKVKGFPSWRKLLSHGEKDWIRFDDEKTSRETPALLFFSSGTTACQN